MFGRKPQVPLGAYILLGLIAFQVVATLISSITGSKKRERFNAFASDGGFGDNRTPQATFLESQTYQR